MIYWKFRFYFGKTTLDGLRKMQEIDYRIKSISFIHYQLLCFIKYLFMILLAPIIIIFIVINDVCKMLSSIMEKPINIYMRYFYK